MREARSSSSPRPSCSPPRRRAPAQRKQEQVSDVNALIKDLSELKVGDPVVHVNHGIGRYRRPDEHRPRRRAASEFLHLEYADKATLYVPVAQLHLISRYTGVARRRGAAAQARLAASGTRPSARPPSRCATPPPSCSNLYARRAAREGYAFRFSAARLRGLRRELRLRGDARPARRDPRRDPGHGVAAADGPPGLRRRRLRQDRGRAARRLRRGHRRQAGRDPRADDAARRAALPDTSPTASASGRSRSPSCRASARRKEVEGRARRPRRRHDRHRRRHAQAAVSRT